MLAPFKSKGQKAFIPFIVAGDPSFEMTEKIIDVLVAEGANIIELGVPFTDAMADGPVIQAASERVAKRESAPLSAVLELARRVRARHPSLGLVLFSYYNPLLKMGLEKFFQAAKEAGTNAVLTVDLPPEEASEYLKQIRKNNLGTVFLASPTTSEKRLSLIEESSSEFIYYISRSGVTGVQQELSHTLEGELQRLRGVVKKPIAVGFGISTGRQAAKVASFADAVVVGSAFVKIISEEPDSVVMLKKVRQLAKELKQAIIGR